MTHGSATKSELRKFGITVGIALLVLAGVLYLKHHAIYVWFATVGAALLVLGLAVPIILKPVYRVWMAFAFALGWFNTRLILGIIFYLIFTPVGLIMRLFGRDALRLRLQRDAESYWLYREDRAVDPKRMERMS